MNLIEQYISVKREEGKSPKYISSMKCALKKFQIRDLLAPTEAEVLERTSLENVSSHVSNYRYHYLKTFYAWVVSKGILKENPLDYIKKPGAPKVSKRKPLRPRADKPQKKLLEDDKIIDEHLQYLKGLGRAKRSIKTYKANLKHFLAKDLKHPTQDEILDFITEEGLAPGTLLNRFTSLRNFYSWLYGENRIFTNPMIKLKGPSLPKRIPQKVMSKKETMRMLEGAEALTLRDRTSLELLYTCSLRRKELVNLDIEDFDSENLLIKIKKTKNGKGRIVPIGKVACDLLNELVKGRDKGPIFLNRFGTRIGANHITCLATDLRRKTKIRTKATSHSFRKSSATHMLREGAPLAAVQALLGHTKMKSTEVYTKVYPGDLVKMHRAFHPREREKNLQLPILAE